MSSPAVTSTHEPVLPSYASHALSSVQERRLISHIEEKLFEIQRQYKKRNYETSSLRTMTAYIDAIHPLFTLVLLIPPISSSVHLRASLLLRLTGEFLDCIPGYEPDDFNNILNILEEIDHGWLAVLRSQAWDPTSRQGISVNLTPDGANLDQEPISQTERTRLRSLLISGTDKLEDWLEDIISLVGSPDSEAEARELEDLRQRFDDLFDGTLAEMGELGGSLEG